VDEGAKSDGAAGMGERRVKMGRNRVSEV